MKQFTTYLGLFLLLWFLLIFGLMFSSKMEAAPDTDQRFSRFQQIALMKLCLQDAKEACVSVNYLSHLNHGAIPTAAATFFEYRTK